MKKICKKGECRRAKSALTFGKKLTDFLKILSEFLKILTDFF